MLICVMQKQVLILFLCLGFSSRLPAQARERDAVGWFSLAVRQKINKHFSYRIIGRVRDGENFTSVRSWYLDGGLYYQLAKNFSMSANYVYAPARDKDRYFRTYHQYYLSANNKFKLNTHWYFSNRVIFQYTSGFFLVDEGYKPYARTDLREKLMLNRRLTRADRVYMGDEVMTTLFTGNTGLRRNRFYAGVNHKFTTQFSADVFFVVQSTYLRKINSDQFIYGLTLNYRFRKMMDDD